jgi:hypothetical protein
MKNDGFVDSSLGGFFMTRMIGDETKFERTFHGRTTEEKGERIESNINSVGDD